MSFAAYLKNLKPAEEYFLKPLDIPEVNKGYLLAKLSMEPVPFKTYAYLGPKPTPADLLHGQLHAFQFVSKYNRRRRECPIL